MRNTSSSDVRRGVITVVAAVAVMAAAGVPIISSVAVVATTSRHITATATTTATHRPSITGTGAGVRLRTRFPSSGALLTRNQRGHATRHWTVRAWKQHVRVTVRQLPLRPLQQRQQRLSNHVAGLHVEHACCLHVRYRVATLAGLRVIGMRPVV